MRRFLIAMLSCSLFIACSDNNKTAQTDTPGEILFNIFPDIPQPFVYADSNLLKKPSDSLILDTALLFKVMPDSVITKDFGKSNYSVYAVGKINKGSLHYFIISVISGNRRAAYVFNLDEMNRYKSAITLVSTGFRNSTHAYGKIDEKYVITTYRERRQPDAFTFKRNVYVADASTDEFILILTEPSDDEGILDPIESLPTTHRLSGNYVRDDKNFITIRDSEKEGELNFFIHFEFSKGECSGELKGVARLTGENTAEYHKPGNPCRISFTFSDKKVEIKELDGCGSYRDIYCFFEGSFPLKANPEKSK